MGLTMNIAKIKVMVVDNTPKNVNNVLIENVEGFMYLGQHYSLKEKNQDKEIQRRIMAGWAAYAKHRDIFKSNLPICLARQVYNSCGLPAMTYMMQTWTLTKQAQNKLAATQTKMERIKLIITGCQRNERGDTLVEWATSKNFKIMNKQFFFSPALLGCVAYSCTLTVTWLIGLDVPGGLVHDHQTDWPPVVGGCNLLPGSL